MTAPVLAFGSEQPRDLLHNAATVCHLLAAVLPGIDDAFDRTSADGMSLLLMSVEATIEAAVARL